MVDVIQRKAYAFEGVNGMDVKDVPVPAELKEQMEATRAELIERVAEVDEELGELFLAEETPSVDQVSFIVGPAS